MKRRFNVTGSCIPQRHYMVGLDSRLKKIKEDFVDYGSYFVINRGRQYGKTTTLKALKNYLAEEYIVVSLDFQMLGTEDFADEARFSSAFLDVFVRACEIRGIDREDELLKPLKELAGGKGYGLKEMFAVLSGVCGNSKKPVVLMIDEVDSASNNQVFVDFLAQLRSYYLNRDERRNDIIVDYKGEQFIVELKIWHGNEYNERREQQFTDYLDYYHKDKGYMLSFNFNKNKETGVREVKAGKKTIVEGVV